MKLKYINIYGPTAAGKTDFSIKLAEVLNASIINFDSCQFRSYLPSLTMCPIPHSTIKEYLFAFLPLHEQFSAGDFIEKFREIERSNHGLKINVGGSGFYLLCLLNGITKGVPSLPLSISKQIESNSKEENWMWLRSLRGNLRVHMNDVYRVKNYLAQSLQQPEQVMSGPVIEEGTYINIFINPPKEELIKRISARTNLYFDNMCEEVMKFTKENHGLNSNIIGYREVVGFLNGAIDRATTIELINTRTRQYAKTQITFLKNKLSHHYVITNPQEMNDCWKRLFTLMI